MPRTQIKGPDIESTSLESKISNDIDFTKVETERINLTSVNPTDTATFFGTDDSGNSTLHMRIGNGSGDKIQIESWNGSAATSLMEVGQTTVTIKGNLVVSGTTTTVNSETLEVGDNFIILNSGVTGSPTLDAGIKVERGSEADVEFKWNETEDKWETDSGLIVGGNIRTAVGSGLSDADEDTYITVEKTSDENAIHFITAGSERVVIDNNGNSGTMGIMVDNPTSVLEMYKELRQRSDVTLGNDTTQTAIATYDGEHAFWINKRNGGTDNWVKYMTADASEGIIHFYTGNSEVKISDSNLTILNTGSSSGEIYFSANVNSSNQNSDSPRLNFTGKGQTAGFGIQAINVTGYGKKDLVFYAHNSDDYTTYREVMRVNYNGNLINIGNNYRAKKIINDWIAPGSNWHTFYSAAQYEGYSLYANVLYENDAGDSADVGALFHMYGYGHNPKTATRVSGSSSLELRATSDGYFQVRHNSGSTDTRASLAIYAEIVTKQP